MAKTGRPRASVAIGVEGTPSAGLNAAPPFGEIAENESFGYINALGTVGGTPVRDGRYYISSWDGAIGLNLNLPIFNGFLYSAQAKEADLRAQSAGEESRMFHGAQ